MATTKIEWANKVWNPIVGCTKVSAGCKNCYAEKMSYRLACIEQSEHGDIGYDYFKIIDFGKKSFNGKIHLREEKLNEPMLRSKKPLKIFVNSMSDLFHEKVPDEFISNILERIASYDKHTFMILTKRPNRALQFFKRISPARRKEYDNGHGEMMELDGEFAENPCGDMRNDAICLPEDWPLKNLWLGVSVEDQKTADERIPLLLQTPAAKRFISVEPMLGEVDLGKVNQELSKTGVECSQSTGLDWVICGGESGKNARPLHPDWVRSLRDQCKAAGVPFFFKQWGELLPADHWDDKSLCATHNGVFLMKDGSTKKYNFDSWNEVHFNPNISMPFAKVGKKKAGHLLDGKEYLKSPKELEK